MRWDGIPIVYDQIIDDERRTNAAGVLMSLNMLVRTRGGFDYLSIVWAGCAPLPRYS
jgi:hypothetical protein